MSLRINPPEADDYQQVLGVFAASLKLFGLQMQELFNRELGARMGPNWFREIKAMRAPRLDNHNLNDPSFYLKEPYFHENSLSWEFLPKDDRYFKVSLAKLLGIRNDWQHLDVEPTIDNLSKAIFQFETVALGAQLNCANDFAEIRNRCAGILNGSYRSEQRNFGINHFVVEAGEPSQNEVALEINAEIESELEQNFDELQKQIRVPIGGRWLGELGSRKLQLVQATGDLYDDSGEIVNHELGIDAQEMLKDWLRVVGGDADLYFTEHGAVIGPVRGERCVIGYLDKLSELDSSRIQGFITAEVYRVLDGQVVNSCDQILSFDLAKSSVDLRQFEGAEVRLTTQGDVALTDPGTLDRMKIGTYALRR